MISKERFNEKIDQMKGEQAKNVKMFTDEEYQQKIQRTQLVAPRLNKFEVLQVLRIVSVFFLLRKSQRKTGDKIKLL